MISLPFVLSFISSIDTPGALSNSRNPSGVISSTARSVTTFFTHLTPVSGNVQASAIKIGIARIGFRQMDVPNAIKRVSA